MLMVNIMLVEWSRINRTASSFKISIELEATIADKKKEASRKPVRKNEVSLCTSLYYYLSSSII